MMMKTHEQLKLALARASGFKDIKNVSVKMKFLETLTIMFESVSVDNAVEAESSWHWLWEWIFGTSVLSEDDDDGFSECGDAEDLTLPEVVTPPPGTRPPVFFAEEAPGVVTPPMSPTHGEATMLIGEGAFGRVNAMFWGSSVAVLKVLKDPANVKHMAAEVDVLNFLNGGVPQIPTLLEVRDPQRYVMTYGGVTLEKYWDLVPAASATVVDVDIALDVAGALTHCHKRNVAHLDVKPANVGVKWADGTVKAMLLDFGIATLKADEPMEGPRGTKGYMAPEIMAWSLKYSRDYRKAKYFPMPADVYSYGALLCAISERSGVLDSRPNQHGWFRHLDDDDPAQNFTFHGWNSPLRGIDNEFLLFESIAAALAFPRCADCAFKPIAYTILSRGRPEDRPSMPQVLATLSSLRSQLLAL